MKFKHASRKKVMMLLLFMFAASAIAAIVLSAPPTSAKTQQGAPSYGIPINLNGRESAVSSAGLSLSPAPAASAPTTPKIVQTQNYNYGITTHEVTTPTSYIYITPGGNYSFSIALPWAMSYTSLWGNTTSFSGYGIKEQNHFVIPTVSVVTIGATSFGVNTTEGFFTKTGALYCNYDFSSTPETTSCTYRQATGNTNNFNIVWVTIGAYVSAGASDYQSSTQGGNSTIGTYNHIEIGANAIPSSWHNYLNVDWRDFGNATVVYGKLGFLSALYGFHYGVMVMFPQDVGSVDPTIVQSSTGANASGATTCVYGSNTVANDILLVNAGTGTISSDTQSLSWSSYSEASSSGATQTVYYAVSPSGGAETVHVTQGTYGGIVDCYEVSGISHTVDLESAGAGSTSSASPVASVTSYTPASGDFVFSLAWVIGIGGTGCSNPTWTAGSGYTFTGVNNCGNSGGNYLGEEYESSAGGSATTSTFTSNVGSGAGGIYWTEISIAFLPLVTVPISLGIQNSAPTDSATVTCSGGGGTYTTSAGTQNFSCAPSVTVTLTLTAGGTNNRWCFSGACTNSESWTSCASGTCTLQSYNYYEQFQNTLGFSLAGGGITAASLTWTWTGYQSGTSGLTICTDSPSSGVSSGTCTGWSDYNQALTAPATPSGEAANERYCQTSACASSTAGTPTSGGNTYTTTYYRQESNTYQASTNGNGPPTWDASLSIAPTGTFFGTASTGICTISPTSGATTTASCSGYADYNTVVTTPTLASGSGANIQWKVYGTTTSQLTTGGNTVAAFTYYKQLYNTYAANPYSPTTFSASITFAVTGTIGGTGSSTGCTISVPASPSSGSYNCSAYFDYNLAVSLPSQAANNPANTAWVSCSTGCTNTVHSWTDTTGGNTHTGDYVEDLTNTYDASPTAPTTFSGSITFAVTGTIGGATGQAVCTVSVPASPAAGLYGCTGPTDSGTTTTITATSTNNPNVNTRWQVSGTNTFSDTTGGNTHTANYYEQLSNTYQITPNAQTTWDAGLTSQTVIGTYLGTASSTICTVTLTSGGGAVSCTNWADYNLAAIIGVSTVGGAPANSQWLRSGACSFTQTTGGNTNNCNYYKQWTNNFLYSVTYGGSPSAITLSCNELGTTATLALTTSNQAFYCDNAAVASATNPIAGATNERWSDNAQSFTITTGGGANTFAYYHQYDQTLSYSISGGGSGYSAPTATGTEFGASYTPTLTTTATLYWFDVTGTITFTNPLTGSGSLERWDTTTTSLSATAIGTAAPVYYNQWSYQFDYSITDGGSGYTAPTLTYTSLGTGGQTAALTTSLVAYWIDSGTSASSTNPLTGSGSSERWYVGTSSITVSSASSTTFAYYNQYLQTYSYTVTGGGSGYSAPTLTFTYLGTSGQTDTAGTTSATQWMDSTTSWALTDPLTGSGTSERWDANSGTSGTVSGAATIGANYYNQYSYTLSYSVSGGGTPTVPTFSCLQFGSSLVYTLTSTPTVEWADSGCSYSFLNPAQLVNMPTSPTPKERWFTGITASGTVSSAQTVAATYYNQYWLNNTAFTLTYVYTGVTEPASIYQGWVDSGSSLTVAGVYSHIWKVGTQGALYQTNNGIQFYGNHSVSSFTFTTIPLQATFTGTKVNMTQFVDTGISMTLTGVTDNGASISFTTVAVSDGTIYKFVGSSPFVVTYSSNGITSITVSNPIYQPEQTKTFAALSYFWAFYCDGSNINMRTSPDGITWSASTTIASCTNGQKFSVYDSGTTVIYARTDGTNIYYRAGTLSISSGAGVITWLAAEQTAVTGTSGTIGNDGALTNSIALSGDCYYASFASPSPTGILNALDVGLSDTTAGSYSVSVGIYSNAGSLLASGTSTVTVGTAAAYAAVSLSSDLYLASSTSYWLAVTTTASAMSIYASATTGGTSEYQATCTALPSSIGTITTTTNIVDIYGAWHQFQLPFAAIDTNGYSWISYSRWDGTDYYALVAESQATNGVWASAAGFPHQAALGTLSQYATEVAPITSGKVVMIWGQTGQKLTASVWAGSTWSTTYQNTNTLVSLYYFSAQTSFDNVNIAFLWDNAGVYTVQLARFFYSPIGFIADSTLSTTVTTSTSAPTIFKSLGTGNYNIFYVGSGNTVYEVSFSAAASIGTPKLVFTDTHTITNNDQVDVVPLSDSTDRAGFMFVENTATPWKIQYLVIYFSAQFDLILNPDTGALSVNSTNYFTVTYTLNGATQTLQYTGTPNSVLINADAGSTVTISGTTSLSNTAKEVWWFQAGGGSVSFTAGNSTISYVYYDLLAQIVQYAIVDGGSPTAPTLIYVAAPTAAGTSDSPLTTTYTLTTSPVTIYASRESTATATSQLNGATGEIWTPKVDSWKITTYDQIANPINYYHQYQIGVSYKLLFGGLFTAPSFNYTSDGTAATLVLTSSNHNVYIDVTSAWSVTSPLAGSTSTERAETSPSSGTITTITAYVFTYTHQFGVEFKFAVIQVNGTTPAYSGAPTVTVIQGEAKTVVSLTTNFVTTWVDAGTNWAALNPWVSGADTFHPTTVGGIILAQGSILNTNPITIYYQLAPRCIGTNTTLLAESGCFFPAVFFVFANLMGPFFAGLMIAALCMAIYIKTENAVMSVFLFFISSVVLAYLFPPIFGESIIIGIATLITYGIYESIRSGQ